jgi:hypothetical protein
VCPAGTWQFEILSSAPAPLTCRETCRAVWLLRAPEGQGFFCTHFGDGRHLFKPRRIVAGFGLRCLLILWMRTASEF